MFGIKRTDYWQPGNDAQYSSMDSGMANNNAPMPTRSQYTFLIDVYMLGFFSFFSLKSFPGTMPTVSVYWIKK